MKFKKLTIENFGVYRGRHVFNLQTYPKNGSKKQNVIVVKGPNGSGKTTFYRTISLTLFGRIALGTKISVADYTDFIRTKFHKNSDEEVKDHISKCSVCLDFEYIQSGIRKDIQVQRTWEEKSAIQEKLSITVNGKKPEVEEDDYQRWLNDLFPAGLIHVMCFDAEDMNSLVRNHNEEELKKVVKRLLGLHMVEQLNEDLNYYLRNKGGGNRYYQLNDEVLTQQSYIDRQKNEMDNKRSHQKNLEVQEAELNGKLSELERELSAQGGVYAARRPMIKDRILLLDKEIETLAVRLRELSSGLLPFSFAPKLSKKLNNRLKSELEVHRQKIASDYLNDKVSDFTKKLQESRLWSDHSIKPDISKSIIQEIIKILNQKESTNRSRVLLHELSENDVIKVQQWIREVSESVPQLALHFSKELRTKKEERAELQEFLNRAPEEEKLEPIFQQIKSVRDSLFDIRKENKIITEHIGSIQYKLDQAIREQEAISSKIKDLEKELRKFSLAERSKMALDAYNQKLTEKQTFELSSQLVDCFNAICDKELLLSKAKINPQTFNVDLINKNGEKVTIDDFSMGERQLYGLALLWALRKLSGYELPLLIDTPVARLDEVHQKNFINKFLPEVSDQVLLFATNVEMGHEIVSELQPRISHSYELKYDESLGHTVVIGDGHKFINNNESV